MVTSKEIRTRKNIFYSLSAKYFAANKLEWKVLCRCHRVLAFDALPGEMFKKMKKFSTPKVSP